MLIIRHGLIVLWMLICSVTSVSAEVDVGIGFPNMSIGINLPLYPELVPMPGYPVYYAPEVNANYFFYDGMYWVYLDDNWYASSWYNGPWEWVEPQRVPLFVLRIPVRYYLQPPVYFSGWQSNAPPRWEQHWGHEWEQNHRGWDRWRRSSVPARAPRPLYQRQYSGDRYPHVEQQHSLRSQRYHYKPRTTLVRRHFKQQAEQIAPPPAQKVISPAPAQKKAAPALKTPAPVQKAPLPAKIAVPPVQKAPLPAPLKKAVPPAKTPAAVKIAPPPALKTPAPVQKAPLPAKIVVPPVQKAPAPAQHKAPQEQ
jgi:hypothetical protein